MVKTVTIPFLTTALLFMACTFFSCRKTTHNIIRQDNSPGVTVNMPPVARAGIDQVVSLPADSVTVSGNSSYDIDGSITSFAWTKVEGPVSFSFTNPSDSTTRIRNLTAGVYLFELKVIDNGGLAGRDSLRVIVVDPSQPNRPPVANAGPDQVLVLPASSTQLDGSASSDPDFNISSYRWSQISGPSTVIPGNSSVVQTYVHGLLQGFYAFELAVTDIGGLLSKDTVLIDVNPTVALTCDLAGRRQVTAQLVPFGTLSTPRWWVSTIAAGNKLFFAGGHPATTYAGASTRVDIHNLQTSTWSTAELSEPRYFIATAAAGNKVFFGGGSYFDDGDNWIHSHNVDIYDLSSNTWTVVSFPSPLYKPAAIAEGNKIFFVGRSNDMTPYLSLVHIYDLETGYWSTEVLSEARSDISPVALDNKVFFAGGLNSGGAVSSTIDIYDIATASWSVSALNVARASIGGIAAEGRIYWAGGIAPTQNSLNAFCNVEIMLPGGSSSSTYLSMPGFWMVSSGTKPVISQNKILFFRTWIDPNGNGYSRQFDIFDLSTNKWSAGFLPQALGGASVVSANNITYITNGWITPAGTVWKVEF